MQSNVSPTLLGWLVVGMSVLGFAWWIVAANPTEAAVATARTTLPTLPSPNLAVLDQEAFTSRQVYGALPIDIPDGSVGRQDPFARP